ncbi:MAG: ABC transporter permease [Gammaproteobacteria bacterium]|nr:ABC transporter permease [Gammaproteobacteria bacterium]
MNTLTLIAGAFQRRKARTLFTFLSVVVAFMLFCILAAVREGMVGQVKISIAERLDTYNKVNQGNMLPLSYYDKIVSVPGVTAVAYFTGYQGHYRDEKNKFQVVATNASELFKVYQEFSAPPAQHKAWLADRQGAVAGPLLAKRMGWKVGDSIPVLGGPAQKDGSKTWYYHLDGIYQTNLPTAYQSFFVTHYQYYNQGVANTQAQNVVGQYTERIDDPRNAQAISSAIDKIFENATPQTLTRSQALESVSFMRQFGDITAMVIYVGIAVFFTMLLIIGNTMAQSVRERTSEFAMLRALGFRRPWLAVLVLQESLLLMGAGGILGLILGYEAAHLLAPSVGNVLQTFSMTWNAALLGIMLCLVFGLLAGLVPMQRVSRLRVADALRRA